MLIVVPAVVLLSLLPLALFQELGSRFNLFATVFLGIFIEALPYLLLGTLVSGLSVLVMMALAIILSICSTVDAFVALGFVNTFSFGAILSFLVFGPMVDIKSVLMYSQVFRRKPVAYIVLLPLLMSLLAGIAFNYFAP
jgi:uncharacterized membrane protein YraQ (UPF0718 family)